MLQAVKGITTEANFLFKAALGIGFLIFSVKKAIDNQTSPVMEFGKLLLLGGVTWNLFLSSSNDDKHRFMVYDEVTSKSYVISQLLVGMGVSFALMSNFERVVLKSMEKHFSTPQSTNFSNAGLGFSLQVMSTPVLAYAIAKASEQGFVTFASGLSQALTGASRAAGSFANQQALSTQTSIAAPRGDEVWAMNAGVVSLQSAMSAGGGRFSMSAITGGGTTVKDVNTNTNFALGSNGEITNMSIAGLDAKHAQSETQTRQDSLANSIADTHKTGINQGITSNYLRNHGAGVEDTKAIEKAEAQALRETMSEVLGDKSSFSEADKKALEGSIGAYASGSAGLEIFGSGGKIGGEVRGTASMGTGSTETQEYSRSLSKEGQAAFDKMYAEKLGNIIKSSDSVASAYSNALSTSTGSEFADAKQKAHSYSEASQYSEAIQTSNLPNMAENYIAENNLGGTREQQVAAAAKGLENLAARGDLQGLLHYANMNTAKPNADGIHDVSNKSYYSPSSVGANNAHNNDTVANQNSLNNLGTAGGNNIRNEFSQQSGAAISNFKNQGTSTSNVVNNSAKDAIVEQNANRRMGVNPSSYAIQDASKSGNELAKEAQGLFDAMSKK